MVVLKVDIFVYNNERVSFVGEKNDSRETGR